MEQWVGKKATSHTQSFFLFVSPWPGHETCGWEWGEEKTARSLKVTATFYGPGEHETCEIRYAILDMETITRKRCFSAISFNNRAGKCKFFMFRQKLYVCVWWPHEKPRTDHITHKPLAEWIKNDANCAVLGFTLYHSSFFLFLYHLFFYPIVRLSQLCVSKMRVFALASFRAEQTKENRHIKISAMLGRFRSPYKWLFQRKGHLTFILWGKVKSKSGIENMLGRVWARVYVCVLLIFSANSLGFECTFYCWSRSLFAKRLFSTIRITFVFLSLFRFRIT